MTEHFIEKCESCGATISQCRCPSEGKKVRYSKCKACRGPLEVIDSIKSSLQSYADDLLKKHAENCECLLAHFLKETGFKAKDVWMFQNTSKDGRTVTIHFAHKNTAKKYIYPQNHA